MPITSDQIMERLKEIAPAVAFSVSRTVDQNFRWDGDGPDPLEEGFEPCDVKVKAGAIVGGQYVFGVEYLGGSYFKPGEPCGDVHGYLPQMLFEASEDLRAQSPIERGGPLEVALIRAGAFLSEVMRARYHEQAIQNYATS